MGKEARWNNRREENKLGQVKEIDGQIMRRKEVMEEEDKEMIRARHSGGKKQRKMEVKSRNKEVKIEVKNR